MGRGNCLGDICLFGFHQILFCLSLKNFIFNVDRIIFPWFLLELKFAYIFKITSLERIITQGISWQNKRVQQDGRIQSKKNQ